MLRFSEWLVIDPSWSTTQMKLGVASKSAPK